MTKPGRKPWVVQNLLSNLHNIMKIMLTEAYNNCVLCNREIKHVKKIKNILIDMVYDEEFMLLGSGKAKTIVTKLPEKETSTNELWLDRTITFTFGNRKVTKVKESSSENRNTAPLNQRKSNKVKSSPNKTGVQTLFGSKLLARNLAEINELKMKLAEANKMVDVSKISEVLNSGVKEVSTEATKPGLDTGNIRYQKDASKRKPNAQKKYLNRKIDKVTSKKSVNGHIKGNSDILAIIIRERISSVDSPELVLKFDAVEAIAQFTTVHNNFIVDLGLEFGTKHYKNIQQYCIGLLEKSNDIVHPERVSTGKIDRWPNALSSVRPLFHQVRDNGPYRIVGDQIIRSLFAMQRTVEDYTKIDTSTITYKGKVDSDFLTGFKDFLDRKLGDCKLEEETVDGVKSVYWNTLLGKIPYSYEVLPPLSIIANGPNSVPKCDSAPLEAYLLSKSKELFPSFQKLCSITGNKDYFDFVVNIADQFKTKLDQVLSQKSAKEKSEAMAILSKGLLRKITSVTDSGNKSRIIAISDYWTQNLLQPLERNVISIIKVCFPTSCNIWDHEGGFQKLVSCLRVGILCLDAIAWTDTLNVSIQKAVLLKFFSHEFVTSWGILVVHNTWTVKGTLLKIKYLTGQGMGTKGSFMIASLGYLFLMEYLYERNYPALYKVYSVQRDFRDLFNEVGDDLWNFDPLKKIKDELVKLVGVPINLVKSKEATSENLCAEFVSRNLNFGSDVSRFSLNLSRQVKENLFYLPDLLRHLRERCSNLDIPHLVKSLSELKQPNGSRTHPDHIWSDLYKSLIVKEIVFKNDFNDTVMLNSIAAHVNDVSKDSLTFLREQVVDSNKLLNLRLMLLLQDVEYMYSKILKSYGLSQDYIRNIEDNCVIGDTSLERQINFWRNEFIHPEDGFRGLTAAYAAIKTRELIRSGFVSLSPENSVSTIQQWISELEIVQDRLEELSVDAIFGGSFSKGFKQLKYRIDRSNRLQKIYFSGKPLPEAVLEKLLEFLPNQSVIQEFAKEQYSYAIANLENVQCLTKTSDDDILGIKPEEVLPSVIYLSENSSVDSID